ncbi:MAG: ABC transporter ATP-binding protein [Rhizobiaceae bacterium]|nr:ABC transporter ATP-binding protein [Rhizobiaceae bacterium]
MRVPLYRTCHTEHIRNPVNLLQTSSLDVRAVTVDFQGLRAIDDVSLRLHGGEILGLIGPNGAGKTTLINVLTGFQEPTRGSVHLGGEDIGAWKPHQRSRRGLVRTFQSVLPFAGLSALENVEASGLSIGLSRAEARADAERILMEMGLGDKLHRAAGTLPFGEERRVGIARAIAMRPRFLLMDEPAAGLNDAECRDLKQIVEGISQSLGCGVLFIEHRMSLVFELCRRIQVLQLGRTLAVGTPDEIRADPKVRTAYLGQEAA